MTELIEDQELKVKALDTARDVLVSAHVCATRLQAAMRGAADRRKLEKAGKGKKGKGKKKSISEEIIY